MYVYSGMLIRCKTEIPHFLANFVLALISYNNIKESALVGKLL